MKKFIAVLGILASMTLSAAEVVKNDQAVTTDKVGMYLDKGNAFFALQTKSGGVVTFGMPKSVLIGALKDGKARIQIPGIIANAYKPEENALQFYNLTYDKAKGIMILDFAGTEDYIVFSKDEVEKFGKELEKGVK